MQNVVAECSIKCVLQILESVKRRTYHYHIFQVRSRTREPAMQTQVPTGDAATLAFVESTLGDVLASFPEELRDALLTTFCSECAFPMTRELELALHTRLSDDGARHLLFCPKTPVQYRNYVMLLAIGPAASSRDVSTQQQDANVSKTAPLTWATVVHKRCWTLFYLKHASDWAFVVEFVLLDGLHVLTEQLVHGDVQTRGQALDCFVQITSNSVFDWFQDPRGYIDKAMHSAMAALAAPASPFLSHLVDTVRASDSVSGSTFVLLQVLAFFLSWLRKFYAQPRNELRLSHELLTLLRDWRERTQTNEPAELELAQQVYDDFRRWSAVGERDGEDTDGMVDRTTDLRMISGVCLPPAGTFFSRTLVRQLLETSDNDNDSNDDNMVEENETKAAACCGDAIAAGVCLLDAHLMRATALAQRVERMVVAASRSRRKVSTECDDAGQRCVRVRSCSSRPSRLLTATLRTRPLKESRRLRGCATPR